MSGPEGNSWFCFPESPDVRLGKPWDSRENKTNWFPFEWKFRNVTINNDDDDDDDDDEDEVEEEEAGQENNLNANLFFRQAALAFCLPEGHFLLV